MSPIRHRSMQVQADRARLKARDALEELERSSSPTSGVWSKPSESAVRLDVSSQSVLEHLPRA